MKTCRECEHYHMNPEIVNGECQKLKRMMHIDDECEYEISEESMAIRKEVDDYMKGVLNDSRRSKK